MAWEELNDTDLETAIELRKLELVEQQSGFDVDGTLDDPELLALRDELDRRRKKTKR